jgi:hypothetical protein
MSLTKKIIISVTVLIILILVWVFFFKKPKATTEAVTPPPTPNTPPPKTDNFPLIVGSKGDKVKQLQESLNIVKALPYLDLTVDGDFGLKTHMLLNNIYETAYPVTESHFNEIINEAKSKTSIYK